MCSILVLYDQCCATETTAQARGSRSDAAHTSAGPWARSARQRLRRERQRGSRPVAAPASPYLSAGCSIDHRRREEVVVPQPRDAPQLGVEVLAVEARERRADRAGELTGALPQLCQRDCEAFTLGGRRPIPMAFVHRRGAPFTTTRGPLPPALARQDEERRALAGDEPVHHRWPEDALLAVERGEQSQIEKRIDAADDDRAAGSACSAFIASSSAMRPAARPCGTMALRAQIDGHARSASADTPARARSRALRPASVPEAR